MIDRIVFDWKRTLYIPEHDVLAKSAWKVLTTLKQEDFDLVLIGKGGDDMEASVDRMNVRQHFTSVHFEPIKTRALFAEYVNRDHPDSTLVIGDRAQGEIAIAKTLGAKAIWLHVGKFSDEMPLPNLLPDETIHDIGSVLTSNMIQLARVNEQPTTT